MKPTPLASIPGATPIDLGGPSSQAIFTPLDPMGYGDQRSTPGPSAPPLPGARSLEHAVEPAPVFTPTGTPGRGLSQDAPHER